MMGQNGWAGILLAAIPAAAVAFAGWRMTVMFREDYDVPETLEYRPCAKPDCLRKVSPASRYCCGSCATAAEARAPYEIESYDPAVHPILCHGEGCEERKAERGEYDVFEAEAERARHRDQRLGRSCQG
jgi:hypothetical protein